MSHHPISYIHLVPQLPRYAEFIQGSIIEDDPFGQGFLVRVSKAVPRTHKSRLGKIEEALKLAVPQLRQLRFERDENTGQPHLAALYTHWRLAARRPVFGRHDRTALGLAGRRLSAPSGGTGTILEHWNCFTFGTVDLSNAATA